MKRLVILAFLSFSALAANDSKLDKEGVDTMHDLMLTSKWAGMCGMYGSMIQFQDSTKMPGGDEFLERFIKMEMARLDTTFVEFARSCKKSVETYDSYYNIKPE